MTRVAAEGTSRVDGRRTALFVSLHHPLSARRAGFHHLAAALRDSGWRVVFLTVSMSPVALARRDNRCAAFRWTQANRLLPTPTGMEMYVWFTPWHPVNLRSGILNRIADPLFRAYPRFPMPRLRASVGDPDLVLVESGAGLMLVDRLRRWAPRARFVYRQSDWPAAVGAHPIVTRREQTAAEDFDLISVPNAALAGIFRPGLPVRVHPHGVDKGAFDRCVVSPYSGARTRAVFVGMEGLDHDFLEVASRAFPDWEFHLIGPWDRRRWPAGNVIAHGTLPFEATVPYVKFADVGLNCLRVARPDLRRNSLKVLQYTYCRLPVVSEHGIATPEPHTFSYVSGDAATVVRSLRAAAAFPRDQVPSGAVSSWAELADALTAGPPHGRRREVGRRA
jgi:2-beta-glucuronyltransferase